MGFSFCLPPKNYNSHKFLISLASDSVSQVEDVMKETVTMCPLLIQAAESEGRELTAAHIQGTSCNNIGGNYLTKF